MPRTSDGRIALAGLIVGAAWLLIALPIIYAPNVFDLREWLTHDAAGFFTRVLVIVGAVQLVLFIWQLRLIRISLNDAKISADAAADGAMAASRQAHVAEETLARIERPYLYVIKVEGMAVADETNMFEDGRIWLNVEYSIVNHGKIPAIVEEPRAGLSVSNEPQAPHHLGFDDSLVVDPIL